MITDVAGRNLCIGCGICQVACPTSCIKMTDRNTARIPRPTVDRAACTQCGNCLAVCPGLERIPRSEVKTRGTAFERYCGRVAGCFVIDVSEHFKTRYTASGGFVTTLLTYLLDSNRIDGALVVKAREDDPDRGRSLVAHDRAQLLHCAGSLYYPVSLGEGLDYIAGHPGRYAVAGLPCQIQGLQNLKRVCPTIGDRLAITVGLFCGFMPGYLALDYLLHLLRIPRNQRIKRIAFRAQCGPDEGFLVETTQREFFVTRQRYASLVSSLFSEVGCLTCDRMTNEFADFSCGDAAGIAEGQSLVLARTPWSLNIIAEAEAHGYFRSRSVPCSEAFRSQRAMLAYKKKTIRARLQLMRLARRKTPEGKTGLLPQCRTGQWIGALLYLMNVFLTRTKVGRQLLYQVSPKLIRVYNRFVTKLLVGGFSRGSKRTATEGVDR